VNSLRHLTHAIAIKLTFERFHKNPNPLIRQTAGAGLEGGGGGAARTLQLDACVMPFSPANCTSKAESREDVCTKGCATPCEQAPPASAVTTFSPANRTPRAKSRKGVGKECAQAPSPAPPAATPLAARAGSTLQQTETNCTNAVTPVAALVGGGGGGKRGGVNRLLTSTRGVSSHTSSHSRG